MSSAISFFAGAGGLDIGIQKAGFNILLTNEIVPTYCETQLTNHPKANVIPGDIMDYNRERVFQEAGIPEDFEVDLVMGGSPCQSWSTAGKRQGFATPGGAAMLKFADLVNEIQPRFFLLENVRGFLSAALKHRPLNQRGEDFPPLEPDEQPGSAMTHLFQQFGNYRVEVKLLNAADYGVPQTRERVFFVGVRNDLGIKYIFPPATHDKDGKDGLLKWRTLGDVLEEMKHFKDHHYSSYSDERLQYMQLIPVGGGNWRDLYAYGEDVVREAMGGAYTSGGGKVGFYRRASVHKPSPTLLTSPAQKSTNLGHPFKDRPFSIEEYLKIQEFPDGYIVKGSLAQQYTQIGNAVPVRLAEVLGRSILSHLQVFQNT